MRLLSCAGQVAGQRGTVVAIGQPAGEIAESIMVRMDRDGDVLLFAPHELHLFAGPAVDDALQPYSAEGIWTGRGPVVAQFAGCRNANHP